MKFDWLAKRFLRRRCLKCGQQTTERQTTETYLSYKFSLYTFFHDFIHVHSPWAGADNPLGPKFWSDQECLITFVICCKFPNNLFNLWLYTHLFIMSGQVRGRQPQTWGQLLWNVMHYITITSKIIALYYNYNYPVFENVINYVTISSPK